MFLDGMIFTMNKSARNGEMMKNIGSFKSLGSIGRVTNANCVYFFHIISLLLMRIH